MGSAKHKTQYLKYGMMKAETWLSGCPKQDEAILTLVNSMMVWSSRRPPIYIWAEDKWYNETNKKVYEADIEHGVWRSGEEVVPFTPKCKIMKEKSS